MAVFVCVIRLGNTVLVNRLLAVEFPADYSQLLRFVEFARSERGGRHVSHPSRKERRVGIPD